MESQGDEVPNEEFKKPQKHVKFNLNDVSGEDESKYIEPLQKELLTASPWVDLVMRHWMAV